MGPYSRNMAEIEVERSLIEQVQQRNAEALDRLYDEYAPALTGVLSRIISDQNMLDETLQNTFIEIWNQAPAYEALSGSFFLWMIKIAREQAMQAKAEMHTETKAEIFSQNGSGEGKSTNSKMALDLVYFKGYSLERASEQLQIDVDTLMLMIRKELKTFSQKKNG